MESESAHNNHFNYFFLSIPQLLPAVYVCGSSAAINKYQEKKSNPSEQHTRVSFYHSNWNRIKWEEMEGKKSILSRRWKHVESRQKWYQHFSLQCHSIAIFIDFTTCGFFASSLLLPSHHHHCNFPFLLNFHSLYCSSRIRIWFSLSAAFLLLSKEKKAKKAWFSAQVYKKIILYRKTNWWRGRDADVNGKNEIRFSQRKRWLGGRKKLR